MTSYANSKCSQVSIGRVQGSLDISSAVMSINKKSNRIDLDAGDILYHMKVNVTFLDLKHQNVDLDLKCVHMYEMCF